MSNLGGLTPIGKHVHKYPQTEALFEDVKHEDVAAVIKNFQENPVAAAIEIFGYKYGLPGHQSIALNLAWTVGDCIQVWTRGGGKTFFLSMFAWLSAALFPEEKIGIFGPSFRQSKFVWSEIERAYDKSPVLKELVVKRPIITPDKCHTKLYNGSLIEALPLGDGSKIRGARYYRILGDEAAQIPEDILDIVIQGMRATTKDPMEAVMAMRLQRQMIAEGKMRQEDSIQPEKNKMLLTSTAYYQFNHLYRRVQLYRQEIVDPKNEHLNPRVKVPDYVMWNKERALIMFDYQDPPEGFMNIESIMEAKKKMSDLKWKMEYKAYFPPDSEGFFKLSKIDASRSHHRFTVELRGKPQFNYVMGIDVARNSDNFAIAIGRIIDENKVELVNVITLNSRDFPAMHDKIRECLDAYKVIYMCMDAGGGGTSLEDLLHDERMCPKHQKLIWDSVNREEFEEKEGWHTLEMIKFSDDSIPKMAYQLQADLDHGRFLFPSLPSAITEIVDVGRDHEGFSLEELEEAYCEIDETVEETTAIVVQSTRTGKMHLGLPGEISKAHQSEEAAMLKPPRKDRWTAIMLMNWAAHRRLRQIEVEAEEEPELPTGMSMFTGMTVNSGVATHIVHRMAKAAKRR